MGPLPVCSANTFDELISIVVDYLIQLDK